ncbi:hypothetical protein AA106555_1306 [Neokomagataea thailandica NBRC 106555]|uniref:Uncharacterized protein n=2 Tax=Neokomagataea TaxID=1223423 RepID=A0A4Y6V6L2_9PROT|nr:MULTISPECIES: hypothetical protein [Neokomagataea]QDH24498.1 hypothetical protein D5366_03730 [Neokomagataea tanensis]GBR53460.1 hypothetical protein AA106555_1306 [Neokomagataea thailandica NBRC 106555]
MIETLIATLLVLAAALYWAMRLFPGIRKPLYAAIGRNTQPSTAPQTRSGSCGGCTGCGGKSGGCH